MSEHVAACCENANEEVIDGILKSALMSGFNKKVSDRIKMIRPEWRTMGSFSIMDLARNMERDIEEKEKARPQKVMYVGPNGKFVPEDSSHRKIKNILSQET